MCGCVHIIEDFCGGMYVCVWFCKCNGGFGRGGVHVSEGVCVLHVCVFVMIYHVCLYGDVWVMYMYI